MDLFLQKIALAWCTYLCDSRPSTGTDTMFKIDYVNSWYHLKPMVDDRTGEVFMYRDGPSEFRGFPVPIFAFDSQTLGM